LEGFVFGDKQLEIDKVGSYKRLVKLGYRDEERYVPIDFEEMLTTIKKKSTRPLPKECLLLSELVKTQSIDKMYWDLLTLNNKTNVEGLWNIYEYAKQCNPKLKIPRPKKYLNRVQPYLLK